MLAKLIEQKVAEALSATSSDSIFQPFFQPKAVCDFMKSHLSVSQQKKWAAYYEKWGCMRCETKARAHMSLGLCNPCHQRIWERLRICIRELDAESSFEIPNLDRTDMAQQAILDILKGNR
jgi:hypothetical protein